MTLEIRDITEYIKKNRMSQNQYDLATQRNDNRGDAAVQSALLWLQGGFIKTALTDYYDDFIDELFDMSSSDLKSFTSIRAKLTALQQTCLEALIQYSLYEIYAQSEEEEVALDKKKTAMNMLDKIVGNAAIDSTMAIESSSGGAGIKEENTGYVSSYTTSAKQTITGGFKVY